MPAQPPPTPSNEQLTRAHVWPFAVFMGFMLLLMFIDPAIRWDHPSAPWWRQDPAHIIYPIQTLATLGLLIYFWKNYTFSWSLKWTLVSIVFGAIGIGFWLLPTALYTRWGLHGETTSLLHWLGVDARDDGFDPSIFTNPAAWWTVVVLRVFRATVVVALVEEIFWRGFLMRFANDWEGNFWKQPFGKPTWISFLVTTAAFTLAHAPIDYAAAIIYGSLTYLLCIWSKSLGACVTMHATANFLMSLYILNTGKYGLW